MGRRVRLSFDELYNITFQLRWTYSFQIACTVRITSWDSSNSGIVLEYMFVKGGATRYCDYPTFSTCLPDSLWSPLSPSAVQTHP